MNELPNLEIGLTQQNLMKIIKKGHNIIYRQLFYSFYSVFLYVLIFLFFAVIISDEILPIDVILLILNSMIFFFVSLNSFISIWPFWRILDKKFKSIEKLIDNDQLIQRGLSTYINTLISQLQSSTDVTVKIDRNWIIHLIIGFIVVVINAIAIALIFPNQNPQNSAFFWFGIVYFGVFLSYIGVMIAQRKVKQIFHSWKEISIEIKEWEKKLENSYPLVFKDNEED